MATATKTRNTPAANAAAAVTGGKTKTPSARSGPPLEMPSEAAFKRFGDFMAGVITPIRARILWRLTGGACTVAVLAEMLGKTSNGISAHLKGLRLLGLIEATEEGRGRSYSLTKDGAAWIKRLRPCLDVFVEG